mgnify:CR=1 FL=1
MIQFNYETSCQLYNEDTVSRWVLDAITSEGFKLGDINYIFCNDEYLHKLNVEFLHHDTLTDIISFDYKVGKILHGDIFVSVERVEENAKDFDVSFQQELYRVIIHGILHFCGYKDKTEEEAQAMREKENHYLSILKGI